MVDIFSHPFSLWIVIALAAGIIEMLLPSFGFILGTAAALAAAVASQWFGLNIQIVVFALALIASLLFLRPFLLKRRHSGHKIHSRSQALLGLKAEVTEAIDPDKNTGRVMVNGEDWSARASVLISLGQIVEVSGSDGIVLIVKEV
jgi:membrane protein implicated in regulation of membrane protease activity